MEPYDRAFVDIAISKGYVSFEKVNKCMEEARNGNASVREMLVGLGWVSATQNDEIRQELDEKSGATNGAMDDNRFCEEIIRRGLVSIDQVHDAVRMSQKYRMNNKELKSLDEVFVDLGYLTIPQIQIVRGGRLSAGLNLSGATHEKIGQLAVRKGYIKKEQLAECLELQEKEKRHLGEARKLGEILLAKSYIDTTELHDILTNPVEEAKPLSIPGYELQSRIGAGAMGEVFKARQLSVDRAVAIKILPIRHSQNTSYLESMVREAKLLARMDHPNIVKAIDAGRVQDRYFFIMDYVDGTPVQKLLEIRIKLPERDILKIGMYSARALTHAAKHNMVHRDVKPGNIMIAKDGSVKLFDLGVAKMLDAGGEGKQETGAVGTPFYMSPETVTQTPVDIRSDIYSLGATLYHCATGQPPFKGPTAQATAAMHLHRDPVPPTEINPDISVQLSQVILKMMAKDPADRYQTPEELATIMDGIMKGQVDEALKTKIATERRDTGLVRAVKREGVWKVVTVAVILTILICAAAGMGVAIYFGMVDLPMDPGE